MQRTRLARALAALGIIGLGAAMGSAHAQDKVKIGYISDMSSLYADLEGKGGAKPAPK